MLVPLLLNILMSEEGPALPVESLTEAGAAAARRYFVEINGVTYIVGSAAEARELMALTEPTAVPVTTKPSPNPPAKPLDIDPPVLPPPPREQVSFGTYANPQLEAQLGQIMLANTMRRPDDEEILLQLLN